MRHYNPIHQTRNSSSDSLDSSNFGPAFIRFSDLPCLRLWRALAKKYWRVDSKELADCRRNMPNHCSMEASVSLALPWIHGVKLEGLLTAIVATVKAMDCKLLIVWLAMKRLPRGSFRSAHFLEASKKNRSRLQNPDKASSALSFSLSLVCIDGA